MFLLQGVTGSGKTEVYLRLADLVLRSGKSVLVLVPEIALTPAVASAFRDAFGDRVAVQHSGLSDGERSDQWYRIRRGEVSVVVGTRSAVFAPLENLGLIIVDEEHDTSFKQEETPRYNGRDVAVMRGRNEGALVVLGSATPSLESSQNAASARYTRLVMERRVQDRPLASVSVVDMRQEYAEHGPDVILSGALKNAIATEARGRPAVADPAESPRAGDGGVLPAVRRHASSARTAAFRSSCIPRGARPRIAPDATTATTGCSCPRRVRRARGRISSGADSAPRKSPHEIATLWPAARVARLDRDTVRRRGRSGRYSSIDGRRQRSTCWSARR